MSNKELEVYLSMTGKLSNEYIQIALKLADRKVNVIKYYTKLVNVGITPKLAIITLDTILKYVKSKRDLELVISRLELIGYTFNKEVVFNVWLGLVFSIADDIKLGSNELEQRLNDKITFNFYVDDQRKKKINLGGREYRVNDTDILDRNTRKPVFKNIKYIAIKSRYEFEVFEELDPETYNRDKHRLKIKIT